MPDAPADIIAAARRLLVETSWESLRRQVEALAADGCNESHARRVIERKAINELWRALASLLGEET